MARRAAADEDGAGRARGAKGVHDGFTEPHARAFDALIPAPSYAYARSARRVTARGSNPEPLLA